MTPERRLLSIVWGLFLLAWADPHVGAVAFIAWALVDWRTWRLSR
jgi:hypothetical protein